MSARSWKTKGEPSEPDLVWYVDPIDGTTNFAHGHPFFCVSIGLAAGNDPLAGVVYAPGLATTWTAYRGGQTRRNDQPCEVSPSTSLRAGLLATGFPSDRASNPRNNYAAFLKVDPATHGVRRCGAAALELSLVADGSYEGFWDLALKPWDICAGLALVEAAGGEYSDFEGRRLRLDGGELVASNGRVHRELLEALKA